MRHLCAAAVVVVLLLGMLGPPLSVGQMAATAPPRGAASQAPSVGGGMTQRFFSMGAESCGASTCHGSTAPRHAPRTGIRQTEYTQWQANDKHAKAYEAALSTCVETLPRPISMWSHNKTASKHRIRKRRSWVDVLAARPAMTMLKGLGLMVWTTVVVLPLVLVLWAQVRFLPY